MSGCRYSDTRGLSKNRPATARKGRRRAPDDIWGARPAQETPRRGLRNRITRADDEPERKQPTIGGDRCRFQHGSSHRRRSWQHHRPTRDGTQWPQPGRQSSTSICGRCAVPPGRCDANSTHFRLRRYLSIGQNLIWDTLCDIGRCLDFLFPSGGLHNRFSGQQRSHVRCHQLKDCQFLLRQCSRFGVQ